jgi:hypothetical protein
MNIANRKFYVIPIRADDRHAEYRAAIQNPVSAYGGWITRHSEMLGFSYRGPYFPFADIMFQAGAVHLDPHIG